VIPNQGRSRRFTRDIHALRLLVHARGYDFVDGSDFARVCTAEAKVRRREEVHTSGTAAPATATMEKVTDPTLLR
jgi:hypothetical protein